MQIEATKKRCINLQRNENINDRAIVAMESACTAIDVIRKEGRSLRRKGQENEMKITHGFSTNQPTPTIIEEINQSEDISAAKPRILLESFTRAKTNPINMLSKDSPDGNMLKESVGDGQEKKVHWEDKQSKEHYIGGKVNQIANIFDENKINTSVSTGLRDIQATSDAKTSAILHPKIKCIHVDGSSSNMLEEEQIPRKQIVSSRHSQKAKTLAESNGITLRDDRIEELEEEGSIKNRRSLDNLKGNNLSSKSRIRNSIGKKATAIIEEIRNHIKKNSNAVHQENNENKNRSHRTSGNNKADQTNQRIRSSSLDKVRLPVCPSGSDLTRLDKKSQNEIKRSRSSSHKDFCINEKYSHSTGDVLNSSRNILPSGHNNRRKSFDAVELLDDPRTYSMDRKRSGINSTRDGKSKKSAHQEREVTMSRSNKANQSMKETYTSKRIGHITNDVKSNDDKDTHLRGHVNVGHAHTKERKPSTSKQSNGDVANDHKLRTKLLQDTSKSKNQHLHANSLTISGTSAKRDRKEHKFKEKRENVKRSKLETFGEDGAFSFL